MFCSMVNMHQPTHCKVIYKTRSIGITGLFARQSFFQKIAFDVCPLPPNAIVLACALGSQLDHPQLIRWSIRDTSMHIAGDVENDAR